MSIAKELVAGHAPVLIVSNYNGARPWTMKPNRDLLIYSYCTRNKKVIGFFGVVHSGHLPILFVGVANSVMRGNLLLRKLKWDQNKCPLYRVAGCPLFRGF